MEKRYFETSFFMKRAHFAKHFKKIRGRWKVSATCSSQCRRFIKIIKKKRIFLSKKFFHKILNAIH